MSSPIYTATAGPADPHAGTRAKLYAGLALVTPLLAFLASFGIFTDEQANALSGAITAVLGALSAFGFSLAATKTSKQVKDGTFEPAPPTNPVTDAGVAAIQAVTQIKQHVDEVVEQSQAKVAEGVAAIQGAAAMIPGGSLVTGAVLSGPVGDLIQAMADQAKSRG